MILDSTHLSKDLEGAIASRDANALSDAVERVEAACRRRALEPDWLRTAIKALRDHPRFTFAVEVADVSGE